MPNILNLSDPISCAHACHEDYSYQWRTSRAMLAKKVSKGHLGAALQHIAGLSNKCISAEDVFTWNIKPWYLILTRAMSGGPAVC